LLLLGLIAHKKTNKNAEDYFLANRTFGPIILLFTFAATNFSAFTFLGFAGKSYESGFGQYGIMAFGTGFMAIMFYIIGRKVWKLGKKKGYITPPELVGDILNSKLLKIIFLFVMVIFTIPYLATQAIGAGLIIENVTNSFITWQFGAILTMIIIMVYVLFGGMRGSGWTDLIQGVIMIIAMVLAVVFISNSLGGFENANLLAFQERPDLFTRPGVDNYFTPFIWLSFMLLWLFADPMFPQIFSRFYTAKNEKSLKFSLILYPIVVSFLFLFPVLIGVWAQGVGLNPNQNDLILPIMVKTYAPSYIYSFVMIGALAALMSTADSQLLSLSTMLSHDLKLKKFKISEINFARILIIILSIFAIFFVIINYDPNTGIMGTLVKTTFSGLAILCPTTIAALYWKKATKWGCISSILIGLFSIFIYEYNLIPTFGFLSAIWAVLFSTIALIIISFITRNI
jgi:SSS family solute:Na+ symporter